MSDDPAKPVDSAMQPHLYVLIVLPSSPIHVAPNVSSLLQMVWPDDDVDMGSDMGPSQVNEYLSASGGLLPHLGAGADGFPGPQQALAVLVVRRFKVTSIHT